jgi:hypothetical protein
MTMNMLRCAMIAGVLGVVAGSGWGQVTLLTQDRSISLQTAADGFVDRRIATDFGVFASSITRRVVVPDPFGPVDTGGDVNISCHFEGGIDLIATMTGWSLDQTGTMGPTDGRLEAATVAALAGYGGPVALMSFNPHAVETCARLAPALPRGLTTSAYDPAAWAPLPAALCDRLRDIPDATRTGASFLSHEAADLARPRVAELAAAGLDILCWTIRSPEHEAAARMLRRPLREPWTL